MNIGHSNENVSLLECVNPKKNRWRVRWDVQVKNDGNADYMEEEFGHKPDVEDIEAAISGSRVEAAESELKEIGKLLEYNPDDFLKRYRKATDSRIAADPYLQLMEVVREQHATDTGVSDRMALRLPDTFHSFSEFCRRGGEMKAGIVFTYAGKSWRVVQTHTPVAVHPPSMATASLYTRIEPEHDGTPEDPVPYEQGMAFEEGKYYEQYGVTYLCILTTAVGYPNDLEDLPTIVKPV